MAEFTTHRTRTADYTVEWDADADVVEVLVRPHGGDSLYAEVGVGIIVDQWLRHGCPTERPTVERPDEGAGVGLQNNSTRNPGAVEFQIRKALELAFQEAERHV